MTSRRLSKALSLSGYGRSIKPRNAKTGGAFASAGNVLLVDKYNTILEKTKSMAGTPIPTGTAIHPFLTAACSIRQTYETMISLYLLGELLQKWTPPPRRTRVGNSLSGPPSKQASEERLKLYAITCIFAGLAVGYQDCLFLTVNLGRREKRQNVLDTLADAYKRAEVPILYCGVEVPETVLRGRTQQRHMHLLVMARLEEDELWEVLDFRKNRNRRAGKSRSIDARWVDDLLGLVHSREKWSKHGSSLAPEIIQGYLLGPKNLGVKGTSVFACQAVRRLAQVLVSADRADLNAVIRHVRR